ncbi:MAG: hypothetical protein IKO72_00090 [Kiritimatiellae bacterium]|nr:hypothetical protein [Kiritimatiellia bacterium]
MRTMINFLALIRPNPLFPSLAWLLLYPVVKGIEKMAALLEKLALHEFGTLDGVIITYYIDPVTRRIHYCFTRR